MTVTTVQTINIINDWGPMPFASVSQLHKW